MQQDERQMENIMKKLRIGDWNVGGTKGLRFYVPETYEQEREAMESEFQREEASAKQENRIKKNDKVTQRMRDVFTTEQEENMQQDALVDAELEDDFRLQGEDDDYGDDDDGEYNQRDGGLGAMIETCSPPYSSSSIKYMFMNNIYFIFQPGLKTSVRFVLSPFIVILSEFKFVVYQCSF